MSTDCDDCQSCRCGQSLCEHKWPPNTCTHGFAICELCRPDECIDCAIEVANELADHDIPGDAA